jgi:hypothetical protein
MAPVSRSDAQRVIGGPDPSGAPTNIQQGSSGFMEDSPTTQLRQRRASIAGISLDAGSRQHEPLTAARGILLGAGLGAVSLGIMVLAVRALWRYFA